MQNNVDIGQLFEVVLPNVLRRLMKNPEVPCPQKTCSSPLSDDTTAVHEHPLGRREHKRVSHNNLLKEEIVVEL